MKRIIAIVTLVLLCTVTSLLTYDGIRRLEVLENELSEKVSLISKQQKQIYHLGEKLEHWVGGTPQDVVVLNDQIIELKNELSGQIELSKEQHFTNLELQGVLLDKMELKRKGDKLTIQHMEYYRDRVIILSPENKNNIHDTLFVMLPNI